MSITFTNILNKVHRATGTVDATYTAANIAIDVNIAQDEVWAEALKNNGWNVDDFNQTDYPIITTNLVSGQRDYTFVTDETSNRILDIYKVQVMDKNGVYHDLEPVDQQGNTALSTMTDGGTTSGLPSTYDLTGNGIFLDVIPLTANVTLTNGLRVFIDREPTYFTSSDTTKVSGIDPLCQDYLYLKPSYEWCRDHDYPRSEKLYRDLQVSMKKIQGRYGVREKNKLPRLQPLYQNNK